MSVRLLLTDEAWAAIAPLLATLKSRAGRPPVRSDRLFIEAVLYLARTGLPWRDLPEDFGRWDAVYNRFRRWEVRGLWRRLWEHLQTTDCPMGLHKDSCKSGHRTWRKVLSHIIRAVFVGIILSMSRLIRAVGHNPIV